MFALVSPEKILLPPGSVIRLPATWEEYQALSAQRGDASVPRIKYHSGEVRLMSPLPQHGRDAHLLASVITTLLDHREQDYDAFTPVTMELPQESGIEPDYCFYIDNWQAISGKTRINWQVDPPPDLVLEVDVTSYSNIDDYLPYRIPEVWLFKKNQLFLYRFQTGDYSLQTQSQYFPDLDLQDVIAECFRIAYERNTSAAIRSLRQRLTKADQS